MTDVVDVAIVGAGPAGSFFAQELARLCPYLTVLLIDGQSERRKKPCGGLLAPDAQRFFAELDRTLPKHILADPQIFTVQTIDLVTKQVRYYQRHYWNMDRYRFDRWLLSFVPSRVKVLSDRAKAIGRKDGLYAVTLSEQTVYCRFVVGADGGNSLVRRYCGEKASKQYLSIQEWYPSRTPSLPYYSCIFDAKTSDSCSWSIHKDGWILFGGAFEKTGARQAFAEQKARLEEFMGITLGTAEKREACLLTSPRRFRDFDCGRGGVFLLGEAAGLISASSFEGISAALVSAKQLAKAFSEGGTDAKKIRRAYQKKTLPLRMKLWGKTFKRKILCSPFWRYHIMKSGVCAIPMEQKIPPKEG